MAYTIGHCKKCNIYTALKNGYCALCNKKSPDNPFEKGSTPGNIWEQMLGAGRNKK